MNKTLPLAERLKQQQQKEQEIILGQTQEQLDNLRNKLNSTFESALNSIENDMERLNRSLGWKFLLSRWLIPASVSIVILLGLLLGAEGVIKLYVHEIKELQEEKLEMEMTVEQLKKSGGMMQVSHCGKKEKLCIKVNTKEPYGANGDYLIVKERK